MLLNSVFALAQVSIQYGNTEIALNEAFTISITVKNEDFNSCSAFPEINGFKKNNGTSSSSSVSIVNGSMSSSRTLTQAYIPTKEGDFSLAEFTMEINGKKYTIKGVKIKVGPARQQQRRNRDPFADFFDDQAPQEFVEVKDDAFYTITASKKEVYRGEGFSLSGHLYIPAEQQQLFASPSDLGAQLQEVFKQAFPKSCWEEKLDIPNLEPEIVTINGRKIVKYLLFQSTFFPFKVENIKIPATKIKLIKYKIAKQRSFFGTNAQEDSKTFSSAPIQINVKDLPSHPLKDIVPVGEFRLSETIDKNELTTDQNLHYTLKIKGKGNINALTNPEIPQNENLTIFTPNTFQQINRAINGVSGEKTFEYNILFSEPGNYNLKNYFNIVYFDPTRKTYDTLSSKLNILVKGESKKNISIDSKDLGDFYLGISNAKNELKHRSEKETNKFYINLAILSLALGFGFIGYKKYAHNG